MGPGVYLNCSRMICEFHGPMNLHDTVSHSDERLSPALGGQEARTTESQNRRRRAEQPFFGDHSCEGSYEAPFVGIPRNNSSAL